MAIERVDNDGKPNHAPKEPVPGTQPASHPDGKPHEQGPKNPQSGENK